MSFLALAEFAPMILQWFGGSKTALSSVENIVRSVTGSISLEEAISVLKSDPNKVVELQKALIEKESQIELSLIFDRQEARKRELSMMQTGKSHVRADVMVIAAVAGLGVCLVALGLYGTDLPGEVVGIISTIAGIFGACLKDAYAFEFGSSRGSREKDITMAALMDQL